MAPGFTIRDLVAVKIRWEEGKDQKDVALCSAYFPLDSVEKPPPTEFQELVEYRSEKNWRMTPMRTILYVVARGSIQKGESLCECTMVQGLLVQNKRKNTNIC